MSEKLNIDDDKAVLDFVVEKGNGVKGLVDSGLINTKVPDIFIQPLDGRVLPTIPLQWLLIDLSELDGPNHAQVVDSIINAAENIGFFQVVNHGVPLDLLDSLNASANRFFNQPPEAKAIYRTGSSPSHLVKYGIGSSITPEKKMCIEWRDYLNLSYTNDDDAQNHWPNDCKEDAFEYMKSSMKLLRRIMEILLQNIGGLTDDDDDNIKLVDSLIYPRTVNLNYYPACPYPDVTVGVRGHCDISSLTVLLQDGIGGLQVKLEEDLVDKSVKKGEWIEICPVSGALVINIGYTLQIISNGQYKSAVHRVRTTQGQSRVSVPLFVAPKRTEKIGPLKHLVKRDGVCRYQDIVYGDFLKCYPKLGKKPIDYVRMDSSYSV